MRCEPSRSDLLDDNNDDSSHQLSTSPSPRLSPSQPSTVGHATPTCRLPSTGANASLFALTAALWPPSALNSTSEVLGTMPWRCPLPWQETGACSCISSWSRVARSGLFRPSVARQAGAAATGGSQARSLLSVFQQLAATRARRHVRNVSWHHGRSGPVRSRLKGTSLL
ncbi:hypothetical protein BU16DRAFT_591881 [Lophium mytilinum]|uniref:Uncharacterized protein n=1 Tax=Lophium mytilinum TaxID=390894 RepID=A0A6A6QRF3_9PEZI|nr:hypothetical protein BU16DRAFT_591881 [Lophium mytilinum]